MPIRVLIASPIRGGASPSYIKTLFSLMFSKQNKITGGPNAPFELDFAMTSGTSVAMARDELADMALRRNFDRMFFYDVDLGHADSGVACAMFFRLMSHDVDVVGGQYVGHNFQSQFHGATVEKPELRSDGLLEMSQIPLGWSSIKVSALRKIKEAHPHLSYLLKETSMKEAKKGMFEFFPNGVIGPNSAEGKLARIKEVFKSKTGEWGGTPLNQAIKEIVDDSDYSQNIMMGEDFYFCKLAREAGVKLFTDNNLICCHSSSVWLPVKNQDILTALTENWRLHNSANPEQVKEVVEKLRPLLCEDIP